MGFYAAFAAPMVKVDGGGFVPARGRASSAARAAAGRPERRQNRHSTTVIACEIRRFAVDARALAVYALMLAIEG